MKLGKVVTAAALVATASVFALPANAALINWTTTSSSNLIAASAGNTRAYTSDGVTLTASAFSTHGATASAADRTLETACLNVYGSNGLAVVSKLDDASDGTTNCESGVPNHAVDNTGSVDGILMKFSSAVQLTDIAVGYVSGDSDFSVFYYTPTPGAPPMAGSQIVLPSGAPGAGWSLLTSVNGSASANTSGNTTTGFGYDLGNTSISSMYWYVSAYLDPACTPTSANNYCATARNDFFKVSSVSGKKVPEPATLALLGLGLAGLGLARRRRESVSL